MRVFYAENKRILKTEDSLAEDAVWGEPLSSFPDFPDGLWAHDDD
jgi:hypothetical protein